MLALGLVIGLFATPVGEIFFDIYRHPFYDQFPEVARFRAQRTLGFSVDGGLGDFNVDLARPIDIRLQVDGRDGYVQRLRSPPATSPTPVETTKPGAGGPWPWFEWALKDVSAANVTVLYDIESRTVKWDLSPADSGTSAEIPRDLIQRYIENPTGGKEWQGLNGRWKIDPQQPVLAAKAIEIAREWNTVLEKAEYIYFFLQGAYKYSQGNIGQEPKDSLGTYETGTGDCDEVAFLYISMLRAVGVPAWPAFGLLYSGLEERWVGHAWVQFFIPDRQGGGWIVEADPVNYQWLFRSANRVTEWVSDGDSAHMVDFYNIISYSAPAGVTPQITDRLTSVSYESEGAVFNKDTSREIKYVSAAGAVEALASVGVAVLAVMARGRLRRSGKA